MALEYNLTKIRHYEITCYDVEGLHTELTTAILWLMPVIGIPSITRGMVREVYLRISLYERLFGALHGQRPITMTDVLQYVGLSTNAEHWTDRQWEKKMLEIYRQLTNSKWDDHTGGYFPPVLDRNRLDHGGTE